LLNARNRGEEKNMVANEIKTQKFNPNKVKGLIAEKGITQEILASVLGISDTALNYKLLRKSQFKDTEIAKMADYFNVDVSYFFSI
jgi:transcriptional regulator with XRE-family HTH domain